VYAAHENDPDEELAQELNGSADAQRDAAIVQNSVQRCRKFNVKLAPGRAQF
jgi:hypothetical protein